MLVLAGIPLTASLNAGSIALSFPTQSGLTYTFQYKNNLTDPTWSTLTTVAGDGTTKIENDGAGLASRFYRVSAK
jgi:hypothetical protein